jgi:DNA-binding NarL/FixJ family response regulator
MTVRVVVVDDQRLVREGLTAILSARADIEVVGEAADGAEAVALAGATRPDVVLMDLRMPGVDGVTATALLTALPEAPRVLVLTTYDTDDDVFRALRAGASGFLLKDVRREELVAAVRAVADGDRVLAPDVTRRVIERAVSRPEAAASASPPLTVLSRRETEVLRLVALGLSNAEIAQCLVLGETTVKSHVGSVLLKLGLRNRVQAVVAAYEQGLVVPGGPRSGPRG